MRLYVLYLIWKYPTLTSLTLLLMRKNLAGAWSKVGATKNLSVLSQKSENYVIERCHVSHHIALSNLMFNFSSLRTEKWYWVFCIEIVKYYQYMPNCMTASMITKFYNQVTILILLTVKAYRQEVQYSARVQSEINNS